MVEFGLVLDLDWIGLDWIGFGLDWIGLNWTGTVRDLRSTRDWKDVHGYRGHLAAGVPQANLQDSGEFIYGVFFMPQCFSGVGA